MAAPDTTHEEAAAAIPRGQRFFDNWPVLMLLGVLIMLAVYTGWGLFEILTMPKATLP